MTESDYQMAWRCKESIKRYEEMKLKINELYQKVKDGGDKSDAEQLAAMILEATADEAGMNVLSDLVYVCVKSYDERIKECEKMFEEV